MTVGGRGRRRLQESSLNAAGSVRTDHVSPAVVSYNHATFGPCSRHPSRRLRRSPRRSAKAGWGRCIGPRTRSSSARSRSRSCPPSFAADADRLARFQREAEVARVAESSATSPHIYGLEEAGGITALVMELVEGEDLSQRIARGADPARRGAADREADRRGARSRARAGRSSIAI